MEVISVPASVSASNSDGSIIHDNIPAGNVGRTNLVLFVACTIQCAKLNKAF